VPRDGEPTRRRILDTALRRFADDRLNGVSLNEIVSEAGQRNASALQYHFGNREGLIKAILEEFTPPILARRQELLAIAEASPEAQPAAEAFVVPLGELLFGDWRQLCFIDVATQLWSDPGRRIPELTALTGDTAAFRAIEMAQSRLPELPPKVRFLRARISALMVMHAIADKSKSMRARPDSTSRDDIRLLIDTLVDMYLNCLTLSEQLPAVSPLQA
jgi:AcrR family transcriptional regulator